ncbi:MAG: type IX secretion system membrane protein PorP/SprF [Parabacteroides distasonis]|nr:type IX secretion system membrane protein PorP/SprF [Parabacteroides distasonis]MBQ4163231.1 type IX secretion system membrane protein PorP/SprF [Parabacteroides sp.]
MKKYLLLVVMMVTCVTGVRAQYDSQLSQYFMAMGYYNPAYVGVREDLNLLALSRLQWLGIEGAPKSIFINADMPLKLGKTNHGVGLSIFTEGIGLFQNTHVNLQYAYKQKLFGGTLSVGLQFGLVNQSFNGEKVFYPTSQFHQQQDQAIPNTQVSGMGMDIGAGLYYTHKKFYVGVGATHLNKTEVRLDEYSSMYLSSTYNLTGGYNIQLRNPLYELQPSVFLKTDMQSFQADITARLVYNKMFNGGFSWRVNESVILLLGAKFGSFHVGYAYDFPTTPILKGTSGSHELMVSYKLKLKKSKSGKNKHKSVRIL